MKKINGSKLFLAFLVLFNFFIQVPISVKANDNVCNILDGECTGKFNENIYPIYQVNPEIDLFYDVGLGFYVTTVLISSSGKQYYTPSVSDTTADIITVRHNIQFAEFLDSEKYYDVQIQFKIEGLTISSLDHFSLIDDNSTGHGTEFDHGSYGFDYDYEANSLTFNFKNLSGLTTITAIHLFFNINQTDALTFAATNIVVTDKTDSVLEEQEKEEQNNLLSSIIGWIQDILSAILNLPSLIYDKFIGVLTNIWNSIKNLPTLIANALKQFFENIVNAINKIQQWLTDLLNGIIQGLKDLFIPGDDYFKNYFDSLYYFFSEKLGILLLPFDILISLLEKFINLSSGDGIIHIPNIEFMGETLIPQFEYNLKADVTTLMGEYYDLYYLLTDVIIYSLLINFARIKFEEVVGG